MERTPHRVRPDGSVVFSSSKKSRTPGPQRISRMTHDEILSRFNSTNGSSSGDAAAAQQRSATPGHLPPLASTPPPAQTSTRRANSTLVASAAASPVLSRPNRVVDRQLADSAWAVPDGLLKHDDELEAVVAGGQRPQLLQARLKLPQHMLSQRESVRLLEASLDQRLASVAADSQHEEVSRHDSALAAHEVLSDVAHELTRQVAAQCEERGRLLARVWLRYTDVVNSLTKAWEDEKHSHAQAEQQSTRQVQQLRRDYATVVSHAESMLREVHTEMARVASENSDSQAKMEKEVDESKAALRRLQSEVRKALRTGELGRLENLLGSDKLATTNTTSALASLNEHTATRRIRELEVQVRDLDAQKTEAERQLVRLDLEYIDAKAEVSRLRGFLRGSGTSAQSKATMADASTQCEDRLRGPKPDEDSPRSCSPNTARGAPDAPAPDADVAALRPAFI